MKSIYFLLLTLVLSSCIGTKVPSQNFDWLIGNWQRTNDKSADNKTYEEWKKESRDKYVGYGWTVNKNDTISAELIYLEKKNGKWNFIVYPMEDTIPTLFTMTNIEKDKFECENPENEFPKKITYSWNGKELIAVISNADFGIDYIFIKK